ncbi:MAG TPA: hypothetical protein VMS98_00800, partial [Thermoanaerobaculia bacterium]|nr:hypothetical protein [Thermoanaerobaculia bacterium]
LRGDVVWRDWRDFYASRLTTETGTSVDQFGNRGDVRVTVNTNDMSREYRALILSGQWNPSRFRIGGNYTLSELEGNDNSEGLTTGTSPTTPNALWYPEYLDYSQRNPEGHLPEDARHRARMWVGYDFALGPVGTLNVSLLQTYMTGRAYSAAAFIDATGRIAGTAFEGIPTNPGYTLSQIGTNHTYFFSKRGEFRTDAFNSTDLALSYNLPIRRVSVFLQAAMTNVLDNDGVINPNTTVVTRRTGGAASGLQPFNPKTETPIEGVHWRKGASFGQATDVNSYQLPRSYNFSAGLRF